MPGEDGDMIVHSSTQHPTEVQHMVAEVLGVPMHAVPVEIRRMGGGFGGKESQGNALAVACAVAAAKTGRPGKMRYDRDDDMIITGKRHDFRIGYRVGFDAGGQLVGVDFDHFVRARLLGRPDRAGRRPGDAARRQRLFRTRDADRVATGCAPTPSRPRRSAASAGRRACSGSSG